MTKDELDREWFELDDEDVSAAVDFYDNLIRNQEFFFDCVGENNTDNEVIV